ncbi:hypothetical protein [Fibrella forsythiae]|uniref:Uncharacterized protein n=1 Tax=Fibrella forsythiae TaxID=2817061 RepID=A0ABS3JCH9_9BACT|nr:hypothetical protein [Fibrella forsythiae]MBO0946979.1 hypothetical protein [Fibrella forsythiae]
MNSPARGAANSLTAYRAQFQTIEAERADVQEKLAIAKAQPWYTRLVRRAKIKALQARYDDLQQKSDSLSRILLRLYRQHNADPFQ